MSTASTHPNKPNRDFRALGVIVVLTATILLGYLVTLMPAQEAFQTEKKRLAVETTDNTQADIAVLYPPLKEGDENTDIKTRSLLGQAKQMLEQQQFQPALDHLNQIRAQVLHRPESLVLMGEAFLGLHDYQLAQDFFNSALDRDPGLADAYFGFAIAAEALSDLELGLSAMRSYLHLQNDPYQLKVAQARSAIWEWESKLGRGRWGGTKGIPPGFTAEELKRDDQGAGTKMPIPDTEDENGISRYEIRLSDKIEMFER